MEITINKDGTTEPAEFQFSVDDIPEYSQKIVARATVDALERFLRQPEGREMLGTETARRRAKSERKMGTVAES